MWDLMDCFVKKIQKKNTKTKNYPCGKFHINCFVALQQLFSINIIRERNTRTHILILAVDCGCQLRCKLRSSFGSIPAEQNL